MTMSVSSEGFLLLDSSMNPIFVNAAAMQILVYPKKPGAQKNLNSYLANRIRSMLFSKKSSTGVDIVLRFQSGRRTYWCRNFQVNSTVKRHSRSCLAILFERASTKSTQLSQLYERFHLTKREREVAQFLLHDLTSKEIGLRMKISPNTVKAFLRLIMMKMGVSTRSGIIGKALTLEL